MEAIPKGELVGRESNIIKGRNIRNIPRNGERDWLEGQDVEETVASPWEELRKRVQDEGEEGITAGERGLLLELASRVRGCGLGLPTTLVYLGLALF